MNMPELRRVSKVYGQTAPAPGPESLLSPGRPQ
jgi:hypothetical protein